MEEMKLKHRNTCPEEDSCHSDSGDTVILKDDESSQICVEKSPGLSFVRFISVEGGQTTDGALATTASIKHNSNHQHLPLPQGLSFLENHPYGSTSISPGSFMFTDLQLQMALDEHQKDRLIENNANMSTSTSSSPGNSSCSNQDSICTSDKQAFSTEKRSNMKSSNELGPRLNTHLTDLRYKNREAARKCRAKKKNYIQQLEHDYKVIKEKYAICQQENDDLKRFIFQHIGITLTPKPNVSDQNTVVPIAPAAATPNQHSKSQSPNVPVVVNAGREIAFSSTHALHVPGQVPKQPILPKVAKALPARQAMKDDQT